MRGKYRLRPVEALKRAKRVESQTRAVQLDFVRVEIAVAKTYLWLAENGEAKKRECRAERAKQAYYQATKTLGELKAQVVWTDLVTALDELVFKFAQFA